MDISISEGGGRCMVVAGELGCTAASHVACKPGRCRPAAVLPHTAVGFTSVRCLSVTETEPATRLEPPIPATPAQTHTCVNREQIPAPNELANQSRSSYSSCKTKGIRLRQDGTSNSDVDGTLGSV